MVRRVPWTVVALVLALAAGAGGAAGAARLPGAPASLFECASQIRELYMGRHSYDLPSNYNRNNPPSNSTTVYISVYVNRVSGVDENKEEITLDVFLQVHWEDWRLQRVNGAPYIELPWEYRFVIWMPDLYILQLRDMKILSVFQEMTSLRIYQNSTVRVSIGATVIIKCDMDFGLYPLDVQKCSVDFSSYKYTAQDVKFVWREDKPLWYSKTAEKSFRLPKYVVSFATDKSNNLVTYGEGTHSAARLNITLSRELRSYLLESYLPSSLFVIISWGSFCVIPEIVPGRMVLLVTTLLSLVTMFDTVRNNSPSALELKCIEVWLISCTMFVFLALLEYFIVLFGIRYDKSWRRRPPAPAPVNPANHTQGGGLPGPGTVFTARVATSDDAFKQQLNAQTISRESPVAEEPRAACPAGSSHYARFSDRVERAVLFCGAQKGTLDRCALMLFPLSFLLFAIIYWTTYLSEASKAQAK